MMEEWISLEEAWPKQSQLVWLWYAHPGGGILTPGLLVGGSACKWETLYRVADHADPTCWMEMETPEPPKVEPEPITLERAVSELRKHWPHDWAIKSFSYARGEDPSDWSMSFTRHWTDFSQAHLAGAGREIGEAGWEYRTWEGA